MDVASRPPCFGRLGFLTMELTLPATVPDAFSRKGGRRMVLHSASPWGDLTGAPLCALDHARNMAPDYEGELLLCRHGPLEDKAREAGVPVWCTPFLFLGLRHASPLRFAGNAGRVAVSRLRYVVALVRHLRRHPGILHIHSRAAHLPYALLAGWLARAPMAMTMHEPWIGGFEEWWHLVLMRLFRIPVVCLSKAMVAQYPRLLRPTAIIPNALREMPPPCAPRPADGAPPVIGMVGTMIPEKGIDVCLEACRILKERGVPFELHLVGYWLRDAVRREADDFIARHGLASSVRILGEIRSGSGIYENFAIFFLPTRRDSFPRVVMEAMGHALPVVATRVDGIPEMVEDGSSGILVEPGDAPGFADALERLLRDPGLRARMGQTGRELAESRFSPEAYRKRFGEFYASLPSVRRLAKRLGVSP